MRSQSRDWVEFVFFAAIAVSSVSLYLQALKISNPGFDILGPGFAPRYLTIIVGGLSALIALRLLQKIVSAQANEQFLVDNQSTTTSQNKARFIVASLLTLVYVAVVAEELVSFWTSSAAYIFTMQIVLSELRFRRVGLAVLITFITIVFAYFVTSRIFDKAL